MLIDVLLMKLSHDVVQTTGRPSGHCGCCALSIEPWRSDEVDREMWDLLLNKLWLGLLDYGKNHNHDYFGQY